MNKHLAQRKVLRFGTNRNAFLSQRALTLVQSFFAQFSRHILLGKLNCQILCNKRVISIPYYSSEPLNTPTNTPFEQLGLALSHLVFPSTSPICDLGTAGEHNSKRLETSLQRVKEVEVRLIELHYPYLDSSILAQYVAMNRSKYNFTRMHKRIFKKASSLRLLQAGTNTESALPFDALPGHITGLKMELAGRLTTQRSIPRKTVSNKHTGSFHVQHRTTPNLFPVVSDHLSPAPSPSFFLSQELQGNRGNSDMRKKGTKTSSQSRPPVPSCSPIVDWGSAGEQGLRSQVTNQSHYGAKNKLGAYTIKV